MSSDEAVGRLIFSVSAYGDRVAECELAPDEAGLIAGLAEQARRAGARRLWVHCTADLSGSGLARCEGYRRFVAGTSPPAKAAGKAAGKAGGEAATEAHALPVLDVETVADVWPRAFRDQWGHRTVDTDLARTLAASPDGVFIGLREHGRWTGLCRIEPADRLIDGPGFADRPRTADAVRTLVLGACAYLGDGPVTVETWGEPADPYLALGFDLAEDGGGWELMLDG